MVNSFDPDYCVAPGDVLKETLESREISIVEFSKLTKIPVDIIKGILSGSMSVSDKYAMDFDRVLGISYVVWLNLEDQYNSFAKRLREQNLRE